MKKLQAVLALLFAVSVPGVVLAEQIGALLIGYEEVPSVSTVARGRFLATITPGDQSIEYALAYDGLQGAMQQAHIHIAQSGANGSIVLWLCQTATTPAPATVAGLTPFCPQSGTVTGTLTSASVLAGSTTAQQLTEGDLQEVITAIRSGVAYVNVHTTPSPSGEIRGQIRR